MHKVVKINLISIDKTTKNTRWLFLVLGVSLGLHLFFMGWSDLFVEEAYYWNYAQHLDWSYLDHPPMVALLIKLCTSLLGTHEFSVRMGGLLCWVLTAFFSYKLTELLQSNSGIFAIILLAVLPFFFIQTFVITPDLPLLVCWSACVYFFYRALVLDQSHCWYMAGIWLGLGMLSKYTISLLGVATLFYVITVSDARFWFKRKEPYLCVFIAALIFTPVIYWNATHEWVSFLFQSKRRFDAVGSTHFPYLMVLIFLFITPLGVFDLCGILKKKTLEQSLKTNSKRLIQIYTLIPLGFFILYSINHKINLNWIGPLFLPFVSWIAVLIKTSPQRRSAWYYVSLFSLACYTGIILLVSFNTSQIMQQEYLIKLLAWESLTKEFNQAARKIEIETKKIPIFVPLDPYSIGSELSFYQTKLLAQGTISKSYSIVGSHIFGLESLMYRYWSDDKNLNGRPLILISKEPWRFDTLDFEKKKLSQSPMRTIWSLSQNQKVKNIPFYYKVVCNSPRHPSLRSG